jgi:hypothetical protein
MSKVIYASINHKNDADNIESNDKKNDNITNFCLNSLLQNIERKTPNPSQSL